MAVAFAFPDVGEGIQEGEIVKWKIKEGDVVKQDQIVAEIETDKAIVELPSPAAGTILKLNFKQGQTVKVGETLLFIGKKGESTSNIKKNDIKQEKKAETVMGVLEEAEDDVKLIKKKESKQTEQVLATPAVRALAKKLKIYLNNVKGSGKEGRILESDLKQEKEEVKTSNEIKVTKKYDMYGYVERKPLSMLRKTISQKLTENFTIAHVTHTDEADITELLSIKDKEKSKIEKKGVHLTLAPFLIKAIIAALKLHPTLNAALEGDELVLKKYYNIGIATDTEEGLLVPVLKIADQKSILQLARELHTLTEAAKSRKIDLADLKGSSFTLTNIGSIGGIFFTPIINPGDVAILGTGKVMNRLQLEQGKVVEKKYLPLSLTFDHRALDGAEAARFVNDLKKYLEDPELLLIE